MDLHYPPIALLNSMYDFTHTSRSTSTCQFHSLLGLHVRFQRTEEDLLCWEVIRNHNMNSQVTKTEATKEAPTEGIFPVNHTDP